MKKSLTDKDKLTSVHIKEDLLSKFNIESKKYRFTFRQLVERSIHKYITNDEYRKEIHCYLNTQLENE